MPRPNPPRKRPRKRPAGTRGAARADATLTKQTAQSTQSKGSGGNRVAAVASTAATDPEQMWSRRSYLILIVVFAALVLALNLLQWALATSSASGARPPLAISLIYWSGNPITLVAASIVAALVAKRITQEPRPLRLMESLSLGLVAYFISTFASVLVLFVLGASSATQSHGNGAVPTPLPNGASPTASVPSPTATPATASASPRPSGSTAGGSAAPLVIPGDVYAGFVASDLITLVGTYYLYPPLYKRLRLRRPPPRPRKGDNGDGGRGGSAKPSRNIEKTSRSRGDDRAASGDEATTN